MESILVKILATALALSQVTTAPDAVKTRFERAQDQQQVAELLRAGCTHMRKAFDIEDINLEDLIATALRSAGRGREQGVPRDQFLRPANGLPGILQERESRSTDGRPRRLYRFLQQGGR